MNGSAEAWGGGGGDYTYTHAYTHTHTHTLQTHRKAVLKLGVEEAESKHIQRDKGLEKQFRSASFSLNSKPKTLTPSTCNATVCDVAICVYVSYEEEDTCMCHLSCNATGCDVAVCAPRTSLV